MCVQVGEFWKRYITPEILERYNKDRSKCPFCGNESPLLFLEDEISTFGDHNKPGYGFGEMCCRSCYSRWTERFEVRLMGIDEDLLCDNEFNDREKMLAEDIAAMERDGWEWDGSGWNPPATS